jgi:hypothetical protein
MTGFAGTEPLDLAATWIAAAVTLLVLAYLFGERRLFRYAQHLLAGLATGYAVLIAVREVLIPRLVEPLANDPASNVLLWAAAALVVVLAAARWLPRAVVAIPVAVLIAGTAAFALGGAVAGTLLPQLASSVLPAGAPLADLASATLAMVITALVLVSFLHGIPRGTLVGGAAGLGRLLVLGGIGGWLGFLIVSRLVLLVDRLSFLLSDWLRLSA